MNMDSAEKNIKYYIWYPPQQLNTVSHLRRKLIKTTTPCCQTFLHQHKIKANLRNRHKIENTDPIPSRKQHTMDINDQSTHEVCEMTVPTKQYDARPTKKTFNIDGSVPFKKSDNPFLYYSINENRMNTLLGKDD